MMMDDEKEKMPLYDNALDIISDLKGFKCPVCQEHKLCLGGPFLKEDFEENGKLPVDAAAVSQAADCPLLNFGKSLTSWTCEKLALNVQCDCKSCEEKRDLEHEQVLEILQLHKWWSELKYTIWQAYQGNGMTFDEENLIIERLKRTVHRLCARSPHQLFLWLKSQVQTMVVEMKLNLLKQLGAGTKTTQQAKTFVIGLLDEYTQLCAACRKLHPILMELEQEHLTKLGLNWELVNRHLFQSLVYADHRIQNALPCIITLLRSSVVDENEQKELTMLLQKYLIFDEQMTIVSVMSREAEGPLRDLNAADQYALGSKLRLADEVELFKMHRNYCEQQQRKKRDVALHRCRMNSTVGSPFPKDHWCQGGTSNSSSAAATAGHLKCSMHVDGYDAMFWNHLSSLGHSAAVASHLPPLPSLFFLPESPSERPCQESTSDKLASVELNSTPFNVNSDHCCSKDAQTCDCNQCFESSSVPTSTDYVLNTTQAVDKPVVERPCECHICVQHADRATIPTVISVPPRPAALHLYPHIHGSNASHVLHASHLLKPLSPSSGNGLCLPPGACPKPPFTVLPIETADCLVAGTQSATCSEHDDFMNRLDCNMVYDNGKLLAAADKYCSTFQGHAASASTSREHSLPELVPNIQLLSPALSLSCCPSLVDSSANTESGCDRKDFVPPDVCNNTVIQSLKSSLSSVVVSGVHGFVSVPSPKCETNAVTSYIPIQHSVQGHSEENVKSNSQLQICHGSDVICCASDNASNDNSPCKTHAVTSNYGKRNFLHSCGMNGHHNGVLTEPAASTNKQVCKETQCNHPISQIGNSVSGVNKDLENCQGETEESVDDSCSEQSSTTSASTQRDAKHCDCCYCEVFGHDVTTPPSVSRNYPEMREKLRQRLNRKKMECKGDTAAIVAKNKHLEDQRDVDSLINFINGCAIDSGSEEVVSTSSRSVKGLKKGSKKVKKVESRVDKSKISNGTEPLMEELFLYSPSVQEKGKMLLEMCREREKNLCVTVPKSTNPAIPLLKDMPNLMKMQEGLPPNCKNEPSVTANGPVKSNSTNNKQHTSSVATSCKSQPLRRSSSVESPNTASKNCSSIKGKTDSCSSIPATDGGYASADKGHCMLSRNSPVSDKSSNKKKRKASQHSSAPSASRSSKSSNSDYSGTGLSCSAENTEVSEQNGGGKSRECKTTNSSNKKPGTTMDTSGSGGRSTEHKCPSAPGGEICNGFSDSDQKRVSTGANNKTSRYSKSAGRSQKCLRKEDTCGGSTKDHHMNSLTPLLPPSSLQLLISKNSARLQSPGEQACKLNCKLSGGKTKQLRKKATVSQDSTGVDDVFVPRDIDLDNGDLDEMEREVEAFKRFCWNSVPLANKEKVNVNLKDIVIRKKTVIGCS